MDGCYNLLMDDMDGLKCINDTFGHAEGDFAIMALAKAVTKMGKDDMLCARVGGVNFVLTARSNYWGAFTIIFVVVKERQFFYSIK